MCVCVRACLCLHMPMYTCSTYTCVYLSIHACMHACMCTPTPTHPHAQTNKHTHARTHARTHTHTHTHTQVKIDDSIWTPETGLVTASLKVQRKPLRDRYNAPGGLLDLMGYRFPES